MKRVLAAFLVIAIAAEVCAAGAVGGVPSDGSMYLGGSVREIPEQTVGQLNVNDQETLSFEWKGGTWKVPYKQITSLEYGQKAGRRVGVAIAFTWMALFSKKRRHFLTIGFTDAQGNKQAALIEIGKARVKVSLAVLETRTGLKVEYETQEAREHVHG